MAKERVREALLYESLGDKVQCHTCERHCLETGFCATRKNIGGQLYTLEYGDISSISANPIEKKPFFHFYPGTKALTIGSWSCNFTCPWCQNYDISKSPQNIGQGQYISPAAFIEFVRKYCCQGTSVSFNEPTLLLEYSLDIFELARDKGYYNTYVTNGYMTAPALDMLVAHGLDAMNIDIKGESEVVERFCAADIDMVWRNAAWAKERGVWVELTTLVIPDVNDTDDGLSLSALEKARGIGKAEGLKFVYIGNVPGHPYENTYCPGCQQSLIERYGFSITKYNISPDKHCSYCGEEVSIIGRPHVPNREG